MLTQRKAEDAPATSPPAQVADQAGTVPPETCLSCGYVLAGIPVDSPCPECGLSAASRNAKCLMERAPNAALRRLRIGALAAGGGLIVVMVGLLSSIVVGSFSVYGASLILKSAGAGSAILVCFGLLAVYAGSLILVWTDPLKRRPVDPPPQRIVASWAGAALPITLAGAFLTSPWLDPGVWIVLMGVEFLTWSIATLRWITRLLSELPDQSAARRADSLVTGWFFSVIWTAIWFVVVMGGLLAMTTAHHGPSEVAVLTVIILGILPAIIMFLVMIRALRSIRSQCGTILAARA